MSASTFADVRSFVLLQLGDRLAAVGVDPERISDDADLLGDGTVDSFGVLELMSVVGDHFGVHDAWEEYDPEDILVLGAFCRFVARAAGNSDRLE